MIPSVDFQGRMLLAAPDRVAVNPNGHGGTLLALRESGVLEELRTTGVELIHYFQVDNPLVAIADTRFFLGYHELRGAEMSSKAVEKTGPEEKVGVFARVNNRPRGDRILGSVGRPGPGPEPGRLPHVRRRQHCHPRVLALVRGADHRGRAPAPLPQGQEEGPPPGRTGNPDHARDAQRHQVRDLHL